MFKKYSSIVLVVLSLLLVLSIGVSFAQDTVARGGTVVVNESPQGSWVRNFSPFAPNPLPGTTHVMYDPLVVYNPVDGGKPTWWLATGSKYADDLKSVTFTLRDGVKWSDGQPFTADDVVFTFNLFVKYPALDRGGILAFTDSVTKVDALTVTFNLKSVYTQADIQIGAMLPVPQHVWSTIADPTTYTNDNPVATGAFTEVKNFSDQVYSLCRNTNYWQNGTDGKPLPYVDCLQYPAYTDNNAANLALINGEMDWGGNFVPDLDTTYVAKDPEHFHYYFYGGSPWVFMTNTTKKPFDDVKVRWAMDLAIDYNTISQTAENGYTTVDPLNASGIYPKWKDWVPASVNQKISDMGLGTFNEDKAKQILDDAGYKVGSDGFRNMPDGTPIGPFKIQIVNGWTDVVTAAQIISQGFQDVGLNASVVTPDFGAWQTNLQQGTFDTSLAWSVWGVTPYDFYHNILGKDLIDDKGVSTGQFQPRIYSDDLTKALQNFLLTADATKQKDIVGQLADYYVTNVVSSPLSPWPAWYEYSTLHFTGWPTKENYFSYGPPWDPNGTRVTANAIHCVDATSCGQK